MAHLNLEDILNAKDTDEKKIFVPEWGDEESFVIVRSMTAEARDAYEQSLFSTNSEGDFERNLDNARAKLVSACVIGPDGSRMFKTEAHVKALGSKSAAVVDRLFAACQRINAISEKDVEELAGN